MELGVWHFEELVSVVVLAEVIVVVFKWYRCRSHWKRFPPLCLFFVVQTRVHSRSRRPEKLDDFSIRRNDDTFQKPVNLWRFAMRVFVMNGV